MHNANISIISKRQLQKAMCNLIGKALKLDIAILRASSHFCNRWSVLIFMRKLMQQLTKGNTLCHNDVTYEILRINSWCLR